MRRFASHLRSFRELATSRAGVVLSLTMALAVVSLAGCDKPAQGSQPADAGAAPSDTAGNADGGAPTEGDSAGNAASGGAEGGDPSTVSAPGEGSKPDGESCLAATECASGVCEGEGCGDDQPGTCMPTSRMCTRDRREFCGCDGATFYSSSKCPGARFSKREAC
jgi:hypothetical protein